MSPWTQILAACDWAPRAHEVGAIMPASASAFFQMDPVNSKLVAQFSVALFTGCPFYHCPFPICWLPMVLSIGLVVAHQEDWDKCWPIQRYCTLHFARLISKRTQLSMSQVWAASSERSINHAIVVLLVSLSLWLQKCNIFFTFGVQ